MGAVARPLVLLLTALWLTTSSIAAQELSRAEMLRQRRLEKTEDLEEPDPPGRLERFLGSVEGRLTGGAGTAGFLGLKPRLGGLKDGAGPAAGIRFDPFSSESSTLLQVDVQVSLRKYWGTGLRAGYAHGPVRLLGYGRYRHMPREVFYGAGPEAALDRRTDFRLNEGVLGGLLGARLGAGFSLGARGSWIRFDPGPGHDDDIPDAVDFWSASEVDELLSEARHAAFGGWVEFDTRDPDAPRRFFRFLTPNEGDVVGMPLATDRGLFVEGEIMRFTSLNDRPYGFTRLTLQGQQYVRFRHGRNVFAFREFLALSRAADGQIPLYMLPALGGAYTLRGFELYRFRDRNALMLNAEYRWHVWLFADLALFIDAGDVFHNIEDISIGDLQTSFGAGLRMRSWDVGVARLDVARSREGTQVHVTLGALF